MRRTVKALLLLSLVLLAAPAWADKLVTLYPSTATTADGSGAGLFDTSGYSNVAVVVSVTAGSGTVNPFKVFLQGSWDGGTTWADLAVNWALKTGTNQAGNTATGGSPPVRDCVSEVAVVTSAKYICALVGAPPPLIRAAWGITGTTPSETFTVLAVFKD